MITGIILAAGLSTRFGFPKALAQFHNKTVIEHIQTMLLEVPVEHIIVVLGAFENQIKHYILKHKDVKVVHNKDYKFGQTSSFKCALKMLPPKTKGVALFPVDYPIIKPRTVKDIIEVFNQETLKVLIPSWQGRKGHPPIFSSELVKEFLGLDNGDGLNTIAYRHEKQTLIYPVDDVGVVSSFNTREEFEEMVT